MRVITPDEMQELDRVAIASGIDALDLMERAGLGLAEEARSLLGMATGERVRIVCGKGKNGGDGLVAARYLAEWGARVEVDLLDGADSLHPDARANLGSLPEAVTRGAGASPHDLIIDCIFGIGFRGEATGRYADAIERINDSAARVLACDIPSGIDGLTGAVRGPAVRADATVTFALPKTGLYLFPGAALVGRLVLVDIGIPDELVREVAKSNIRTLESREMGAALPS
ncbi:MAG: NAD(P)H-hydrate epimerase, partial [Candidatus Geothermincolia bacterium]